MVNKEVVFHGGFSVTHINTQEGFTCDECDVSGPCFVFEREKGGGWWHMFCLSEEQFQEFSGLVVRARGLFENGRKD